MEPQITYSAANAMITSVFFDAAMGNDNVAFVTQSNPRELIVETFDVANALSMMKESVLATASTATLVRRPYVPRLKRNRYSSNRTIAPTTDMIQPAI